MNRISGVMKMHFRDRWLWLLGWGILLGNFVLHWLIGVLLVNQEGTYYGGGIGSIYIFMLVAGIVSVSQTFPFAVSFSVTRKDYFIGTGAIAGLLAATTAIALYLLFRIEEGTGAWSAQLRFFDVPYLNEGYVLEQLWSIFVLLVHMYFLGFAISAVYQRFRYVGLVTLGAASLIAGSFGIYLAIRYQWWNAIWTWLSGHTAYQLAWWLVPFIAVYLVSSYLLLRRSTV